MTHSSLTRVPSLRHAARTVTTRSTLALSLVTSLTMALSGCGGSPSPSLDVAQLQGRWATAAGVTPGSTTLVLPALNGSAPAWLLAQDASSLTRLTLVGGADPTASGKTYNLGSTAPAQTVNFGLATNLSATPKTITLSGSATAATTPINQSQTDALAGAAPQADVSGSWSASLGGGAQVVSWSVNASGTISGTSTTGCIWSGSLAARTDARLYTASLTENCAGAISQLTGVATVNADKSRLSVVSTLIDESRALVLLFAK